MGEPIEAVFEGTDPDGIESVVVEFYADGVLVQSGASTSYTPTADDLGKELTVSWTLTDALGAEQVVSADSLGLVASPTNLVPVIAPTSPIVGFNADENSPAGTVFGSITVTDDRDALAVNAVEVSLTGEDAANFQLVDNGEGSFDLVSAPGFVPDFEEQSVFNVTVTATDGEMSSEMPATVTITNVQEGPAVIDVSAVATPPENGEIYLGFNVGPAPGSEPVFTDPDGVEATVYNWYVDGVLSDSLDQGQFVPTTEDLGKTLSFQVVVTDNLGEQTTSEMVDLGVIYPGPNDAPYVQFDPENGGGASVAVDENLNTGHYIGPILVTDDRDMIPGHEVTMSLEGADAGSFRLLEGSATGEYYLNFAEGLSPDFEAKSEFFVTIVATDSEGVRGTQSLSVSINNLQEGPTVVEVNPDGVVYVGETISVAPVLTDPDGVNGVVYSWQIDGLTVLGADGTSYTPEAIEKGRTLTLTVTATDALGAVTTVTHDFGAIDGDPLPAPIVSASGFGDGPFLAEPGKITLPEELDVGGYLFPLSIDNYDVAFLGQEPLITLGGTAASFFEIVYVGDGDFELHFKDGVTPDAEELASPDFDLSITVTGPEGAHSQTTLAVEVLNLDDNLSTLTGTILGEPVIGETLEFVIEGEDADNDAFGGSEPTVSIAWYADGELVQQGDGRFLEITSELAGAAIEAVATAEDAAGAVSEFRDSVGSMIDADITVNAPISELLDRIDTFKGDLQALANGSGNLLDTFDSFLGVWNVIRYNMPEDIEIGLNGISFTLEALDGHPMLIELGFDDDHNFLDAYTMLKAAYDADGLKGVLGWDSWADFGKMVSLTVSGEDLQGQTGELLTVDLQEDGGPNGGDQLAVTFGAHDVTDPAEVLVEGVINTNPADLIQLGKDLVDVATDPAMTAQYPYYPSQWDYGYEEWVWNEEEGYENYVWVWYYDGAQEDYEEAVATYGDRLEAYYAAADTREELINGAIEDIRQVIDVTSISVGQESADQPLVALNLSDVTLDAGTGEALEAITLTFGDADFNVLEGTGIDLGLLDGIEVALGGTELPGSMMDFVEVEARNQQNMLYPALTAVAELSPVDIPIPDFMWNGSFYGAVLGEQLAEMGYSVDQLTVDGLTEATPDAPDIVVQPDSFRDAWYIGEVGIHTVDALAYGDTPWWFEEAREVDIAVLDPSLPNVVGDIADDIREIGSGGIAFGSSLLTGVVEMVELVPDDGFTANAPLVLGSEGSGPGLSNISVPFLFGDDAYMYVFFEDVADGADIGGFAQDVMVAIQAGDVAALQSLSGDLDPYGSLSEFHYAYPSGATTLTISEDTISIATEDADGNPIGQFDLRGTFETGLAGQVQILAEYMDIVLNSNPESYGLVEPEFPEWNNNDINYPDPADFDNEDDYFQAYDAAWNEYEAQYSEALNVYYEAENAYWDAYHELYDSIPQLLAQSLSSVEGVDIGGLSFQSYTQTDAGPVADPVFDLAFSPGITGPEGEIVDQMQITFGGAVITMTGALPAETGEILTTLLDVTHYGSGTEPWALDELSNGDFSGLINWDMWSVQDSLREAVDAETLTIEIGGPDGDTVLQIDGNADAILEAFVHAYGLYFSGDRMFTVDMAGDTDVPEFGIHTQLWMTFTGEGVDLATIEDAQIYEHFDFYVSGYDLYNTIEEALTPVI